ncbi:ribosome maturation factor RimP [Devosia rhodophyticola]|uniref:Ribosome maturation factor RimP n=1 Tax=Devosia rhodophyticola TaxID=3026423 RepID=A0ABY7Z186_9HYPH|nr:ribosome maturation factor RimP [Devosia rhodophyticola]WDR07048.1 ribosome maturation factor RimP [Devosia rhodophyticola]
MSFDLKEKRYIKETGLESRIAAIVEPVANDLGYSLVRIKLTQENGCTLQIMAEDANGHFAITDCERLSKDLSPVLDVEDPIEREYHLEVSSPGIDRPLVRARDFAAYIGFEAKIELSEMIEGRRRFRGFILSVDDEAVTIRLPDAPAGVDPNHRLTLTMLADAKLVMSDALMEVARKAQEENNPLDDDEIETETDEMSDDFDEDDQSGDDDDKSSEEIH